MNALPAQAFESMCELDVPLDADVPPSVAALAYTMLHRDPDAAGQTVQAHIKRLHRYNEIRDVGTGLFGLIAERRGVRVRDVFGDFGVGEDD